MTNNTVWIIVGTTIGFGALATGAYFVFRKKDDSKNNNPLIKQDEFVEDLPTKSTDDSNIHLPILIDKIWVIENTSKFKDSKSEGHNDFIAKSLRVNREMQRRGLTFWRDSKNYGLDFLTGGRAISLPIT